MFGALSKKSNTLLPIRKEGFSIVDISNKRQNMQPPPKKVQTFIKIVQSSPENVQGTAENVHPPATPSNK
jgi:hypothetical protein